MVYINGKVLVIPGVTIRRDYSNLNKQVIPDDHFFMLGDNRPNSADSRVWGFVSKNELIGGSTLYLLANQSNTMGSLTIILNGEEKQTHSGNVLQLIYELNLQVDHIIVELNNTIIPMQDIPTTTLKNNDKVEIIRYIGGGT